MKSLYQKKKKCPEPKPLNLYPLKRSFSVYELYLNKGRVGKIFPHTHTHTHTHTHSTAEGSVRFAGKIYDKSEPPQIEELSDVSVFLRQFF